MAHLTFVALCHSYLFLSAVLLLSARSVVSWSAGNNIHCRTLCAHTRIRSNVPNRDPRCYCQHDANQQHVPVDEDDDDTSAATEEAARVYDGPVLGSDVVPRGGISVGELGLDLVVADSVVAPGSLGLFAVLSEDCASSTLPEGTLLSGYSREGSFLSRDEGDKTVAFALKGGDTAVFYERELMSVVDALTVAARTVGADNSCGLAGHVLVGNDDEDDDGLTLYLDTEDASFGRYFVPAPVDPDNDDDEVVVSVQHLGQFCNDLAWNYDDPPTTLQEYDAASLRCNVVQLVWRLAFDEATNSLVPSWPVSVLARDVTFTNRRDLMELGTRYGWNYWQATVDPDSL